MLLEYYAVRLKLLMQIPDVLLPNIIPYKTASLVAQLDLTFLRLAGH